RRRRQLGAGPIGGLGLGGRHVRLLLGRAEQVVDHVAALLALGGGRGRLVLGLLRQQLVQLVVVDVLGGLLLAARLALEQLVDELVVGRLLRRRRRGGLAGGQLGRDLAILGALLPRLGRLPGVLVLGGRQQDRRGGLLRRGSLRLFLLLGRVLLGGGLLGGGLLGGGLGDGLRLGDLRQLGPLVVGPHHVVLPLHLLVEVVQRVAGFLLSGGALRATLRIGGLSGGGRTKKDDRRGNATRDLRPHSRPPLGDGGRGSLLSFCRWWLQAPFSRRDRRSRQMSVFARRRGSAGGWRQTGVNGRSRARFRAREVTRRPATACAS